MEIQLLVLAIIWFAKTKQWFQNYHGIIHRIYLVTLAAIIWIVLCNSDSEIAEYLDVRGDNSRDSDTPRGSVTEAGPRNDRPQRERRAPHYLRDFVATVGHLPGTVCTVKTCAHQLYSREMAQRPGEKLVRPEVDILDVLEEGELPDLFDAEPKNMETEQVAKDPEPEFVLNGHSVDYSEVRSKTISKIRELYNDSILAGRCQKQDCTYETTSVERMKVHSESHYIIYVSPCTFFSSCRDSVKKHMRRQHPGAPVSTVTQVDKRHWAGLRLEMPSLPCNWPRCPVAAKDYGACIPPSLPTYRITQPSSTSLRIRRTGEFRSKKETRKRPAVADEGANAIPTKRNRLAKQLSDLESYINSLKGLIRYLEGQAVDLLGRIRKCDQ